LKKHKQSIFEDTKVKKKKITRANGAVLSSTRSLLGRQIKDLNYFLT